MSDRDPMMGLLASLVSAVSVLETASDKKCTPQKAVMSDAAFRLMMRDYKKAIRAGRDHIKALREAAR